MNKEKHQRILESKNTQRIYQTLQGFGIHSKEYNKVHQFLFECEESDEYLWSLYKKHPRWTEKLQNKWINENNFTYLHKLFLFVHKYSHAKWFSEFDFTSYEKMLCVHGNPEQFKDVVINKGFFDKQKMFEVMLTNQADKSDSLHHIIVFMDKTNLVIDHLIPQLEEIALKNQNDHIFLIFAIQRIIPDFDPSRLEEMYLSSNVSSDTDLVERKKYLSIHVRNSKYAAYSLFI